MLVVYPQAGEPNIKREGEYRVAFGLTMRFSVQFLPLPKYVVGNPRKLGWGAEFLGQVNGLDVQSLAGSTIGQAKDWKALP